MFRLTSILIAFCTATVAQANVTVRFTEGAPKDRFEIVNQSTCPTGPIEVTIDLSGSAAGLIFDTTAQGMGVEVYQPFELVAGADHIAGLPNVTDGESRVTLALSDLPGGALVAFTIDVDDTLVTSSNGQTRVAGSEIEGAEVRVSGASLMAEGAFDRDAIAEITANTCLT